MRFHPAIFNQNWGAAGGALVAAFWEGQMAKVLSPTQSSDLTWQTILSTPGILQDDQYGTPKKGYSANAGNTWWDYWKTQNTVPTFEQVRGQMTGGFWYAAMDQYISTVPADLAIWYDLSDTASIAHTTGDVTQVNDLSGNDFHLTPKAGTVRTGDATQNSLNVLTLPAGTNTLEHTPISGAGVVDGVGSTIYAVFKAVGGNTYDAAPINLTATNFGKPMDRYNTSWYAENVSTGIAGEDMGAQTTWCIFTWQTEHEVAAGVNRYSEYKNNVLVDTVDTAVNDSYATLAITLGSRQDGVTQFTGDVGEIRVYNAVHDSTERTNVHTELATKWGT